MRQLIDKRLGKHQNTYKTHFDTFETKLFEDYSVLASTENTITFITNNQQFFNDIFTVSADRAKQVITEAIETVTRGISFSNLLFFILTRLS